MTSKLLILGGTTEASALAQFLSATHVDAVFSYAGRVASPKVQPLPTRIGGFGGAAGLVQYLKQHNITHVVDATHPFAAQMSWNAFEACEAADVKLLALTRPEWRAQAGDKWTCVTDIEGAVEALVGPKRRVLLALGKLNLPAFAVQSQHHYVLRLVDHPEVTPPLPNHTVVVARGPFQEADDCALMATHKIDVVVCKNAGGTGAAAKLHAARALGIEVIMIDRPVLPPREEVGTPDAVAAWLRRCETP
ncbi:MULTISPECIES: cobalt-precorrin-6A reductase [unclassified Shimia]|uniref:cobalt-precorrin-6A reductase n=1 Tax=unclassified Shimia TaxID=2630038 RepID=UPI003108AFA8